MQNKGFVRVFAILLTLVCVFYLSFSFVTRYYTNKAKEYAKETRKWSRTTWILWRTRKCGLATGL